MKILLTLFCFAQLTLIDHDVSIAMFAIYQDSNNILLDITFDTEDLSEELNLSTSDITKDIITAYLESNTSFIFDKKINELDVIDLKYVGDHLKLSCIFKTNLTKINKLEIVNTCLLNVDNQSNIIQLDLNGASKDYRMHKKRNTITIDL